MKPNESPDTVINSIDTVLNALGTSEPPQGYEARIHNALLQAQQQSGSSIAFNNRHSERSAAKSKNLLASPLPRMSWAAACTAVILIGIAVRSYTHPEAPHTPQAIAHANTLPSQSAAIAGTNIPLPTIKRHRSRTTFTQEVNAQPRRIEVALLTHKYIPEPHMPLTEDEHLVLRMLRRNTAQQLAEYTPDARARRLHEDALAYNDYFAPQLIDDQPSTQRPIAPPQPTGGTK